MIPYAQLKPGPGFHPTQAALYYCQRLITPPSLRAAISNITAAVINHHDHADIPPRTTCATLERAGLISLPPLIDSAQAAEMRDWLMRRDQLLSDGNYPLNVVMRCPHIAAIATHPSVLPMVTAYLRAPPIITAIGIRWTAPNLLKDVNQFHRDPDGWRFLKLFVYLTDVDAETGPHIFILGSHRKRGSWRARSYSMSEIAAEYDAKSLCSITGLAGTSFLADTNGIHKGEPPIRAKRLMLQVQYALLPNYALDYSHRPRVPDFPYDPMWRLLVEPIADGRAAL